MDFVFFGPHIPLIVVNIIDLRVFEFPFLLLRLHGAEYLSCYQRTAAENDTIR